mgnify:FL=1
MMVLHFIPGGKTAGQVPLRYALENLAKETKMEGVDNENELEELGRSGERISDKKPSDNDHDVMIEMTTMNKKSEDNDVQIVVSGQRSIDEDDFFVPPRFLGMRSTPQEESASDNDAVAHEMTGDEESREEMAI